MTENCPFCGNTEFKHIVTDYIYQRGNQLMVVEGVPATVCSYCGEKYYDIQTLKQIEQRFLNIFQKGEAPTKQVSVPLESWDSLRNAS